MIGDEQTTRDKRLKRGSSQRREQEKLELRQTIITAATELLAEVGYENFSLRQVAERIGYSATTIYLYFKDKGELVDIVLDDGYAIFEQMMGEAELDGNDPVERLGSCGRAYINFGLQHQTYYRVMFMQRTHFLFEVAPGEVNPRIGVLHSLNHLVEEAIERDMLLPGNVDIYAGTFWSMVHGIIALAISMPEAMPLERATAVAGQMLAMAVRGLSRHQHDLAPLQRRSQATKQPRRKSRQKGYGFLRPKTSC